MDILAVNPWITDYAAFDFWLKPYGFLVLLTYLDSRGADVHYLDCLDKRITADSFGRGKFYSEIIEQPSLGVPVKRIFKRYGIRPDEFRQQLNQYQPDYILLTSSMTYWYPGVRETAQILAARFPGTPVFLGGTYATLMPEHAQAHIPCSRVFDRAQLPDFFSLLGIPFDGKRLYETLPDYKLFYPRLDYVALRTSWGCPFQCSYCAIPHLQPEFFRIPHDEIISFMLRYHRQGVKDFVLYDDAFLYQNRYAKNLLGEIVRLNLRVRIHSPNGLHLRFLDEEVATLMKKAGFINPHFGVETLKPDLQKEWGNKVTRQEIEAGIRNLKQGGFKNGEFSVYLLLGYPGQDLTELKEELGLLHSLGAKIHLAEFSPVPKTGLFPESREEFCEPLLQNNSLFGCYGWENIEQCWEIKNYLRELNKTFA